MDLHDCNSIKKPKAAVIKRTPKKEKPYNQCSNKNEKVAATTNNTTIGLLNWSIRMRRLFFYFCALKLFNPYSSIFF